MRFQCDFLYVIVAIISLMTMVSQGDVKHQIEIHRVNQEPIYFKVEIASSPQKMIKGLQDIDYLPLNRGCFLFSKTKNCNVLDERCKIPIDIFSLQR